MSLAVASEKPYINMTTITAQRAPHSASNFAPAVEANAYGMNDRIKRLRQETFDAEPSLSIERALIETRFYQENYGKYPIPILRAMNFYEICKQKTIYIGKDELIVGERGSKPKCVPTFPELTCHSVEDLHVLNTRKLQRYTISQEDIDTYEREVIPYWKGRTQRERIFSHVPQEWKDAYEVGMFTEFVAYPLQYGIILLLAFLQLGKNKRFQSLYYSIETNGY